MIDGQQRLTTLQLFLAALRNLSAELDAEESDAALFKRLTQNPGCDDNSIELFKVWPTNADREDFEKVMRATGAEAFSAAFEDRADALPRMAQAYAMDGRTVQVKATGTGRGPAFRRAETKADHLIFFDLNLEQCRGAVVFNGPERYAIALLPTDCLGQRALTPKQIRQADSLVRDDERLPLVGIQAESDPDKSALPEA